MKPPGRSGWVYVLTNPAMPGLVKIGCTGRTPAERARELSNATGVPARFVVAWAWPVSDWEAVERLTHDRLVLRRPNGHREFFAVPVGTARRAVRRAARAYLRPRWLRLLTGPRHGRPSGPPWTARRPRRTADLLVPVAVALSLAVLVEQVKPAAPLWLPGSVRATVLFFERI